jgi:hypothetical protein
MPSRRNCDVIHGLQSGQAVFQGQRFIRYAFRATTHALENDGIEARELSPTEDTRSSGRPVARRHTWLLGLSFHIYDNQDDFAGFIDRVRFGNPLRFVRRLFN